MKYQVLFLIVLSSMTSLAQQTSSKEELMLGFLEANARDQINFLEKTVNINSGTLNLEGVREVGMHYKKELDDLGFETRWISMPDSLNRAGHLFAEINGGSGKTILLIGHLDTVFEEDHEFQSFSRTGDTAEGPGANDMKGGNAIIIYALKALEAAGELENKHIIVAFTGDEEKPGHPLSVSRYDLVEAGKKADIALGFETASGMNYATVARRGSSGWTLKVKGKQAHSSGIFSKNTGAGAIFEAARILHSFYEDVKGEDLLSFNPGVILGGTNVRYDTNASTGTAFGKTNVVASELEVYGGLRFISEEQKEKTREKMRDIVRNNLPQTSAVISFSDAYPAMEPTEGNAKLLEVLDEVSQSLGYGEVKAYDPGKRGAADISFIAQYVDGLDGLGAMGSGAHSPSETVNLETFIPLTQRAAVLIHRLGSE
ncbi:M20/M25/M40 family metallo-hydrolase [Psychroflexus sediminis]|uniref:Glutamate carboxypeptidase n=1 Tax=Psychroflexus sediminis TaxID=470826 RepID=A0A1G7YFY8_9FLAO|nr:M20/M25/M40 family metallo-hydrolase [Psychroflexus sediminis]SDG95502.1 glutamate carboxypeptidase [Psychroflexus sediminis]